MKQKVNEYLNKDKEVKEGESSWNMFLYAVFSSSYIYFLYSNVKVVENWN